MTGKNIESLNLLPINRIAAIKLKMAGVSEDPSLLAVFQLMQWGIDSGVPLPHRRIARELERLSRDPAPGKALDYLLDKVPGGMAELHKSLIDLRPRATARFLLEVLDMGLCLGSDLGKWLILQ